MVKVFYMISNIIWWLSLMGWNDHWSWTLSNLINPPKSLSWSFYPQCGIRTAWTRACLSSLLAFPLPCLSVFCIPPFTESCIAMCVSLSLFLFCALEDKALRLKSTFSTAYSSVWCGKQGQPSMCLAADDPSSETNTSATQSCCWKVKKKKKRKDEERFNLFISLKKGLSWDIK